MRTAELLRRYGDRFTPEEQIEIGRHREKRGRPPLPGEFAFTILALAQLYWREHQPVSVMSSINAVVNEAWNRSTNEERKKIGRKVNAATKRIFGLLRPKTITLTTGEKIKLPPISSYDEVFGFALHIKPRKSENCIFK